MKNSLYQDDSDSSNDIIYDEDCVESCDCQGICSCLSELDFYADKEECLDCADDCCGDEDCHSRDQEPDLGEDKE
jgi:hypothetical protein